MLQLPGFTIKGTIKENNFYLYRALREKDQVWVIIKLAEIENGNQIKRLEHENKIAHLVEDDWGVKAISLEKIGNSVALIFEDFKGETLDSFFQNRKIKLRSFLKIAVNIARAISKMHEKGIVHKDIKPENILINPQTEEISLIDFEIATLLPFQHLNAFQYPTLLEGTLLYMSPEQTGRMNRPIDYHSDFYSLGVTLYQLLTGKLPFASKDPLELVYALVAKIPMDPHEIDDSIPIVISKIIMRLLEKQPEDRYQSIEGLIYDMEVSLHLLDQTGKIEPFQIAVKDFSNKFQVSGKVYGRENEIRELLNTFENSLLSGIPELVLVSGYSGIGKTSLVNELQKPILRKKGFFVSGKFDQYKKNIPYSTIVEAIQTLIMALLSEPEEKLKTWKLKLQEALGINGRIIAEVIPHIKLIIGDQPAVAELPPFETQNRFKFVLENFINVFCKKEHVLTIFFDDLQWADNASLNLLGEIISNPDNKYIFLIGAYRDNEVSPSHPLMLKLDELRKGGAALKEIFLVPLKMEDAGKLVADTLKINPDACKPLTQLILERTGGNPFFIVQFLTTLHSEGLLKFDKKSISWKWEIAEIKEKKYSDNIIDLMSAKIKLLNVRIINLLEIAACIGNKFEKNTLHLVSELPENEINEELEQVLKEGLIKSYDNSYSFLHDRIQQAVYTLIDKKDIGKIHLKIGRLLFSNTLEKDLDKFVFDIVSQFNLSEIGLLSEDEKIKISKLNLLASRKAKSSVAYASAIKFIESGLRLLPVDSRKIYPELYFQLRIEQGECEYLNGNFKVAQELLAELLSITKSKVDLANICQIKMKIHLTNGEITETINNALDCLKQFNIFIPIHPETEEINKAYNKIKIKIGDRKTKDLINLPMATDPEIIAAMSVLSELYAAAYYTDQNLFFLHLSTMVELSLDHGISNASSLAFSAYGFALIPRFGKQKEAYDFAELGVKIVEKHNYLSFNAKALFHFAIVSFWNKPITISAGLFKKAFLSGVEMGDIPMACYSALNHIATLLIMGEHLDEIYYKIETYLDFARKVKFTDIEDMITAQKQFVLNMKGLTDGISTFSNANFNEAKFESLFQGRIPTLQGFYYILKLQSLFIAGNIKDAFIAEPKAEKVIVAVAGAGPSVDYCFYTALTLASLYNSASTSEKKKYLETLKQNQKNLLSWMENCEKNFRDKYELVSAEIARVEGKKEEAAEFYEKGIKSATKNGFIQNNAIGLELASNFYKERGFKIIEKAYLIEAHKAYSHWGAVGKVKQIELKLSFQKKTGEGLISSTIKGIPIEQLDLLSIIKASQVISGQIALEKLTDALMRMVIEQAGAQKGFLLINHESELILATEAKIEKTQLQINVFDYPKIPLKGTLPENILQYIKRTSEKVMLEDLSVSNYYSSDPYFTTNFPKSVLGLPILKQSKLIGILYLENELYPNAFPPDKISIIELIAAQAAISIENTALFRELKQSKQQLQDIMNNASAVIFVKNTNGKYLFINPQFEKIFKINKEKVIGYTDYDIFPEKFAKEFDANDKRALDARKPISNEQSAPQQDGIHTYVEVKFPLFDPDGMPYAVCGIATDITERKKIEEEKRKINLELEKRVKQRTSELEVTIKDLESFSYSVSHDLHAPLRIINSFANLILKNYSSQLNDEAKSLFSYVSLNAKKMSKLIDDLLALAKFGGQEEKKSLVNMNTIVESVVSDLEKSLPEFKAEIKLNSLPGALVDPILIRQVFSNLISNAIKYSSKKENPKIEIGAKEEINSIIYFVRDNGAGFEMKYANNLFKAFHRLHSEQEFEGTGVGLAIVNRIITIHGGKVWAEAKENEGATFYFSIPK